MLCLFLQDARRVLEKIRLPEEDVDAELREIAATVAEERAAIADDSGMHSQFHSLCDFNFNAS